MKVISVFMLCLCLAACQNYKRPSVNADPTKMSADTLCYRYAYAKSDPALAKEVAARGLDCDLYLEADPLFTDQRY